MRNRLGCCAFILVFAALGCYLGLEIAEAYLGGRLNPWKSAPLPGDAQASNFLPPLATYVYVQSSDGQVYRQDLNHDLIWIEITDPPVAEEMYENFPLHECRLVSIGEGDHPKLQAPRGTIEQLNCIHHIHPEYYIRYRYVILSDGGIRKWEHESPAFGNFIIYILFMLLGGVGGGIGGASLFKALSSLRERSVEDRTIPHRG